MNFTVCTIVAKNYLPAARVLGASVKAQHAQVRFVTLVVDSTGADEPEDFEVLGLADIGIDHDEVLRMAAIYDVTEFCTAVKPWLLLALLKTSDVVAYLDPDIKVYAPLYDIVDLALEHGIVLTPHVTRPMPRDGLSKSETEVLLSGIYNLGFIAVSDAADEFLSFWMERLRRECISDPANMRFVDQRWVDFVPGMYDVCIVRDTTYNVAYWNLDHRVVTRDDGGYLVDGRPLHFFHFSGYSPHAPYQLSKHQGIRPRISLSDQPEVAELCEDYGADLLANGYGEQGGAEYGFARMPNGMVLDRFMRRLYRSALMRAEETGRALPPSPLAAEECDAFVGWLTTAPEESPRRLLSRYLLAVHAGRVDLQEAFPDPEGINFGAFCAWVEHEVAAGRLPRVLAPVQASQDARKWRYEAGRQLGRVRRRLAAVPLPGTEHEAVRLNLAGAVRHLDTVVEAAPVPDGARTDRLNVHRALGRLERRLVAVPVPGTGDERVRINMARMLGRLESRLLTEPSTPAAQPSAPAEFEPPGEGLRVAGYFTTESGVGELGRLAIAAAKEASLPVTTHLETSSVSRQAHPFEGPGDDYDVNLVCVNADELPNFAKRAGPGFFEGHYTIGLWAWELEEFPPAFSAAFDYVDEVWGISTFVRDAIARATDKPVFAFPLPIVDPLPVLGPSGTQARLPKAYFDLPERYTFLYYFDLLSIFERKNPLGLIDAFKRAFAADEGPVLVIKVINSSFEPASMSRLLDAAAGRDDIRIMDGYLEHHVNRALMHAADSYVSLHRSEGFGLTMAEAMAMGKPVIATAYSGNLDFMDEDISYLVSWRPGSVPPGCQPYRAGAKWAEPDLDHAASLMRQVYENPDEAREVGARAREAVLSKYGIGARAEFVRERYEAARSTLSDRRHGWVAEGARAPWSAGELTPGQSDLVALATRPRWLGAPSRHPRAALLYRRAVARALRPHAEHDREVHGDLARAVEAVQSQLEITLTQLQQDLASLRQDVGETAADVIDCDSRLREVSDELGTGSGERLTLSRAVHNLSAELDNHQAALDAHQSGLDLLGESADTLWRIAGAKGEFLQEAVQTSRELRSTPYMADPAIFEMPGSDGRVVLGYGANDLLKGGYASFEDVFRGSEGFIRDRLRPYLPFLTPNPPVVDLGCGRGEMLGLLHEAGVEVLGIDSDASMVARVRELGYDVREDDICKYLEGAKEQTVGAVFCAQVVEHMEAAEVTELLASSLRLLRPGGKLVVETVNPYPVQSFKAFWTDPTHRTMLYPEVLLQLCASAGYTDASVFFPSGTGNLSDDRWSQGEYAVIAYKSGEDAPAKQSRSK